MIGPKFIYVFYPHRILAANDNVVEFVVCNCTAQHLHLSNEFGKRQLCLRAGFICVAAKFSPHARVKFARYATLVRARSRGKISVTIARRPLVFAPFESHAKSFSHRFALKSQNLFQVVIDLRARVAGLPATNGVSACCT